MKKEDVKKGMFVSFSVGKSEQVGKVKEYDGGKRALIDVNGRDIKRKPEFLTKSDADKHAKFLKALKEEVKPKEKAAKPAKKAKAEKPAKEAAAQ